ncbi:MAG: SIR2 family protein [Desulfobacteraceae bacterium]|nr:SIR2 family protein [Desulfobacteraceae bacterium]
MLEDKHWDILLKRIAQGKCTPFLGAGACAGTLPLGSEVAHGWSIKYSYPLCDSYDLARVAQFLAVDRGDPMFPKDEIADLIKSYKPPEFKSNDELHGNLADLPLPVYLTTNYDNFMAEALRSRQRNPVQEMCRWNKYIREIPSAFDGTPFYDPSPANPVVFHLHGKADVPESMVLTEDDYLDFLVNISRSQELLPPRIQQALTGASLLFIGYRLSDWTFRVLFRGLVGSLEKSLRRISVAVQLPPEESDKEQKKSQFFLEKYFQNTDVRIHWATARDFIKELMERWRQNRDGT